MGQKHLTSAYTTKKWICSPTPLSSISPCFPSPWCCCSCFCCCWWVCQNVVTTYLEAYLDASLQNTSCLPIISLWNIVLWPLIDDKWVLPRWYKIILDRVTWDEDFKLAFANVSSFIRSNVANNVFTSSKFLPRTLSRVCYVRDKFRVICCLGCCPRDSSPRRTPVSRFEDIRRAVWKRRPWNVFRFKKIREQQSEDWENIIFFLGEEKATKADSLWWVALHKLVKELCTIKDDPHLF